MLWRAEPSAPFPNHKTHGPLCISSAAFASLNKTAHTANFTYTTDWDASASLAACWSTTFEASHFADATGGWYTDSPYAAAGVTSTSGTATAAGAACTSCSTNTGSSKSSCS